MLAATSVDVHVPKVIEGIHHVHVEVRFELQNVRGPPSFAVVVDLGT